MTAAELNRDIKRMARDLKKVKDQTDTDLFFNYVENTLKPEFLRLFRADSSFEVMNKQSVLILLRINLSYRFIQLYAFGIEINF